jgi:2-C-methyl-D-erythritol 4-phosphate cytidylyltransferase / 2-C-methyl-D-erythritol 2,4-cyclodiphosphate synthase
MKTPPLRIAALIVAAGQSQRMGGDTPKQYRSLAGKTVLRRSVEAFVNHPLVHEVCVVIHPAHQSLYARSLEGLAVLAPVHGGDTRQASVQRGVAQLAATSDATHVLVHDAARCFVDAATISRVIAALQQGAQAVLPTLPVSDTLKQVGGQQVETTIPRHNIHLAQTPQGFELKMLNQLHLNTSSESTDDASLAEAAGITVECVAGNSRNRKLTTSDDWEFAEMLLQARYHTRTGMGYDVHRLTPRSDDGRQLHLCGVTIEHSHVLEGHSDADVGLHALTDALLGALALGDIGTHFPPSDPRWKGADSAQFVTYCVERMHEHHAILNHVDITLICEAPKVGPHRAAMQQRVANLLNIPADCVSIKATTSEGLGFTGRREGIAAQAVATLQLPQETRHENP